MGRERFDNADNAHYRQSRLERPAPFLMRRFLFIFLILLTEVLPTSAAYRRGARYAPQPYDVSPGRQRRALRQISEILHGLWDQEFREGVTGNPG